jgi:two-component system phosphate regulon sensor histidine kinase PhoR
MKNASPRSIVLVSSLVVFVCLLFLEAVTYLFPAMNSSAYNLFIVPTCIAAITFVVFYFSIEKFIYRKIKLIYKNIHSLKSTKKIFSEKVDMSTDIVGEVSDEVMQWAQGNRREIAQLIKQADYRKEFLGNVSHELKTPIMSIQGYLETLMDGGIDDVRINRQYIEKALRNVERMVEIINDLENIAHLESGELVLNYSKFDICRLIKDVFELLEMHTAELSIQLKVKEGCDDVFNVWADEKLIREVLVNLISNAIKYGKQNGKVEAGLYTMGQNILVEVSDNGIGIAKEHLNRVLERFYRVERSRSRNMGGTGLGLAIAKHIIEAHGHNINVRSTFGEGSTFAFTLNRKG